MMEILAQANSRICYPHLFDLWLFLQNGHEAQVSIEAPIVERLRLEEAVKVAFTHAEECSAGAPEVPVGAPESEHKPQAPYCWQLGGRLPQAWPVRPFGRKRDSIPAAVAVLDP